MSRTRQEIIQSTILGDQTKSICWPQVLEAGLIFPDGVSPLECMRKLLRQGGYESPEQLRSCYDLPSALLVSRPAEESDLHFPKVLESDTRTVLGQALLLGLCGPWFYDPSRPVIWTNQGLSRRLQLFEVGAFYG